MTNSLTSALIALVFLFFILRLLTGAKLPTHIGRPRTADGSGRGPALPRLRSGDSRASAGVFAVAAAAWSIAEGTSVVHSETPKVAALAGLAGALLVPVFSLFADLGIRFLIQGFVAVMVGGVGSFIGPVAGAAVIGTLSAALPWVMAPVVADILVFVLAIVFIKFRPQGLLSGKGV